MSPDERRQCREQQAKERQQAERAKRLAWASAPEDEWARKLVELLVHF